MQRTAHHVHELLVAVFPSRNQLAHALDHLTDSTSTLTIEGALIVARATDGEIVIIDDEIGPAEGGLAGGTLGAAMTALGIVQLGALALPGIGPFVALGAGVLMGGLVGAATGRLAVNLLDAGAHTANDQVRALTGALSDELQVGQAALVLQVPVDPTPGTLDRLRAELTPFHARRVDRLRPAAA